jgi:hypothetical protein
VQYVWLNAQVLQGGWQVPNEIRVTEQCVELRD